MALALFLLLLCLSLALGQEADTGGFEEQSEYAKYEPDVHRCVHAANKLRKAGDGTTQGSCSSCDPAVSECEPNCVDLIERLYWSCDGVCLPDGYYFDPQWTLGGCWEDALAMMKIHVERCGCDSGFRSTGSLLVMAFLTIVCSIWVWIGM